MGSFDVEQGGVNSGPDSCGVLEWVWTDGPGFSLCAAPLELSGCYGCNTKSTPVPPVTPVPELMLLWVELLTPFTSGLPSYYVPHSS